MSNRPEFIDEFISDNKQMNLYKKKLEENRSRVIEFLKKQPFEDIYCSERRSKPKFNHEKLYSWLASRLPKKTLIWLLANIIDEEKLSILFEKGKIKYDEIPLDCYDISDNTTTINIPENRKR